MRAVGMAATLVAAGIAASAWPSGSVPYPTSSDI